jgi:hypothetical protein
VAALADPDRGWDAIVIGGYERAFYGSQYAAMAPLFEHYDVQLWAPEVGGRIDFHAEGHEQTMLALGVQSKKEITRTSALNRQGCMAGRALPGWHWRTGFSLPRMLPGPNLTRPGQPAGQSGQRWIHGDP